MNPLLALFTKLQTMFFSLCSSIYDYLIVFPLTRAVYIHTANMLNKNLKKQCNMIDIGTGTGLPLYYFMQVAQKIKRVLAIDIDQAYVQRATETFKTNDQVTVKKLNWMEIEDLEKERFDLVFFGFSFMLMPDKVEALKIAQRMVTKDGKILMFLTLYTKRNRFVEWIKPKIKFFTSIDFGDTIYKDQLEKIVEDSGMVLKQFKMLGKEVNPLVRFFKIYMAEVEMAPTTN